MSDDPLRLKLLERDIQYHKLKAADLQKERRKILNRAYQKKHKDKQKSA